jgi:hypothetical protein
MKKALTLTALCIVCAVATPTARAALIYPLEPFNNDISDLDLYFELQDGGPGRIDLAFHNQSLIDSSMARIYFDDDADVLADLLEIDGLAMAFTSFPSPHNVPGGHSIDPIFEADTAISIGADPAPPKNGINPGQWTTVTFQLPDGITITHVAAALNDSSLRIATHVIALPDGSSASAINIPIPQPATVGILAFGTLFLRLRRH